MNSVEDLCTLISDQITSGRGGRHGQLVPDTQLLEMGLLDSLAIMQIVTALSTQAGIVLPDSEIVAANFRSPEALWALIGTLTAEAAQ